MHNERFLFVAANVYSCFTLVLPTIPCSVYNGSFTSWPSRMRCVEGHACTSMQDSLNCSSLISHCSSKPLCIYYYFVTIHSMDCLQTSFLRPYSINVILDGTKWATIYKTLWQNVSPIGRNFNKFMHYESCFLHSNKRYFKLLEIGKTAC